MTLKERKNRDVATIVAILRLVLVVGLVVALIIGALKVFFFLMPIVVGLVLARAAYVTASVAERAVRQLPFVRRQPPTLGKNRLHRTLAIFFYILLFIAMGLLFTFMLGFVIRFLSTLSREIPQHLRDTTLIDRLMQEIGQLATTLGGTLEGTALESIRRSLIELQTNIMQSLPRFLGGVLSALTGFFSSLPRVTLVVVITIMSGFYFIVQSDRLYRLALRLIPDRQFVRKVFDLVISLTSTLFRILGGYLILMLLTFLQAYLGMSLLHVGNALVWAIVTAIIDFLPVLGVAFTLLPMSIFYLLNGDVWIGLGLLLLFVIMTVLRRVIEPPIIGQAMRLHPLMTILAMILGIAVMGLGGVLAGPLLLVIGREIYIKFDLEKHLRKLIGDFLHYNESQHDLVTMDEENSTAGKSRK